MIPCRFCARLYSLSAAAVLLSGAVVVTSPAASSQLTLPEAEYTGDDRIEDWKGKTILAVTPHPDDETFSCGGTLAQLAKNGNNIQILIYTSDNAGSNDPTMTKKRLAAIRKAEEEEACRLLGIPAENITWLGHDDGMLEYVDRKELTKEVTREIRRHRPDAVFSIDPGAPYEQYHKSDHRSGAIITADAMRAAGWRLYFPELEKEGYGQWAVPVVYFYYSNKPNYTVDTSDVADLKAQACAAHVSQFGDMVTRYTTDGLDQRKKELAQRLLESRLVVTPEGRFEEKFRRSEGYGG